MSVNILYNRLFNLSIFHNYYESGLASELNITPTQETLGLLNSGRMLFKSIPKGATVLYRMLADESGPFIDRGPFSRLRFSLSINNLSEFLNITDLDESASNKFKSGNIVYLKNDPASASTDPEIPEDLNFRLLDFLEARLFTYSFKLETALPSPGDVSFIVTDEDDNAVPVGKYVNGDDFEDTLTLIQNDDESYSQQIDLRDKPKGKYTITIENPALPADPPLFTTSFYADEYLLGKKVTGIVDIEFNDAPDLMYTDTFEYAVRFNRKTTIWKYFIVDKMQKIADLDNYELSITDERSGTETPYASNYVFTRDGDEPHPDVKIGGKDTVIFKSDDLSPIPFYENPLTKIQLKKVPNNPAESEQVIILNLPNPSHNGVVKEEAGNLESEIYVFI